MDQLPPSMMPPWPGMMPGMMPGIPGMMPGMPGMPPWPGAMPTMAPVLNVRVEGLKFEYQLTDDDVRKVFARYGEVAQVNIQKEGTSATVQLVHPHQAMAAQQDLDCKELAGMSGAFLRVEMAANQQTPGMYNPHAAIAAQMSQMAAAQAAMPPTMPGMPGYPSMPMPTHSPFHHQMMPQSSPTGGAGRKNTCKLEIGIENESEFRVGSRAIQIARQIWQDPEFQRHAGKTRLRGRGIGGPHEADEPLALCISCADQSAFEKAVNYAESQLQKVHIEYAQFCTQNGLPAPDLSIKISKKDSGMNRSRGQASGAGAEIPRGERPPNAPTDEDITTLIEERNEARKTQNFKRADEIRDTLKANGVVLMDEKAAKGNLKGAEVTKWRYWRP